MVEESESYVEHLSDEITEGAEKARDRWLKASALLSALLAVLAATASLEAAHYANDAMIMQLQASDQWSYYQAKGIKGMVVEVEQNILTQMGHPSADAEGRIQKYEEEQKKAKAKSEELTLDSKRDLAKHEVLSRSVTLCQVAIAIVAIAMLTKRRRFVLFSCALGLVGFGCLVQGLLMP